MEKMIALRSLYRSISSRSFRIAAAAAVNQNLTRHPYSSSAAAASAPRKTLVDLASDEKRSPFSVRLGSRQFFCSNVGLLPEIKDPVLLGAFRDLMAASWDDLPDIVVDGVKKALSQNTDDQSGKEHLMNVFRAAEAVEDFGERVMALKMDLDDSVGMSGENVKPLSDVYANALKTFFSRYTAYLESFGPDEIYLKKKVENELGTRMIHLKMRCSGIGAEWGKVSILGTSGLSGSYVEQRSAPGLAAGA